jgi:Carboxypeptidase regulatory-like domain
MSHQKLARCTTLSTFGVMFYRALILSVFSAAAFVLSGTASAEVSTIQGEVRGGDGQPLKGAEIRIERKDKKSATITTKTDAKGYYASSGLSAGIYRINVVADGVVKSAVSVKTVGDNARVDFNLKPSAAKKVKHYVWVSAGTGSHLQGRWVEADLNGSPIASSWNVERRSGELAREMMRQQKNP